LEAFLEFCKLASIIPLTKESSNKSAEIYAALKQKGEIIDDIDILIAGICLENGFTLVTNNTKHFSRINKLETANWSS
jgi:predicted nucleic acid-binding protein